MQQTIKSENFTFFSVISIILLIPALFYGTTLAMVKVWIVNETFTHGFLIFPISLWLIWQNKRRLSLLSINPEPRILVLFLALLSGWFISSAVDVKVVQQLSMISMIPVTIWLLFGRKVLLAILFPVLYLFFAVPLGQSLIPPLMDFTADFTVYLVKMFGIPVYRDGLHFTLPTGNWSVVEECSGVRYLIASVALGTIYAYINYISFRKRLIFILMAILVPIIANGFRAFGIVMAGHLSGMEIATGADHILYGWVFFGIVIFLMFYVGSHWWDPVTKLESTDKSLAHSTLVINSGIFKTLVILSIVLLVSVKWYSYQIINEKPGIPASLEISLPENFEGWQMTNNHSLYWKPEFLSPDASVSQAYLFGHDFVQLDIAYYLFQRQVAEVITSNNRLTNPYGGDWKLIFSEDYKDHDFFVREVEILKSNRKILVWQWYKMGPYHSPSPYVAKFFEAYNQIFHNRFDGAYVTIATSVTKDKESARLILSDFLHTSSKDINLKLDSLRNKSIQNEY